MSKVKVISLGGSIIAPDKVDTPFIKDFYKMILNYLEEDQARKLIFVCGGGAPARMYQSAYREVMTDLNLGTGADHQAQDWIGIAATHLNAELMRQLFYSYCPDKVVTDPTSDFSFSGRVLVAAGWKPGFSTDFDAVVLAERFQADTVINLSNIAQVFTDDPRKNPEAAPIDSIGWKGFRDIVGQEWVPGKNVPFDPVASKKASEIPLRVIMASGRDLENLKKILSDQAFHGTLIGPHH